jgi:hypothetical protein
MLKNIIAFGWLLENFIEILDVEIFGLGVAAAIVDIVVRGIEIDGCIIGMGKCLSFPRLSREKGC